MVVIELSDCKFYMDNHLSAQLEKTKAKIKKDDDMVFIVAGQEGAGKSVFAQQLAKKVDPSFCVERICMTPIEFKKAILNAKKGQAVIYDEAYRGLGARGAMSDVNKQLVTLMTEMRQLNLFVIIVLPTFHMLDHYVAVHRSRGLFIVYRRKGDRGYWMYFNNKNKNYWYELPRYQRHKKQPSSNFKGRFLEQYTVDEAAYRRKKKKCLDYDPKQERRDKAVKYKDERDKVLAALYAHHGSYRKVSEFLKDNGYSISHTCVKRSIDELDKNMNN